MLRRRGVRELLAEETPAPSTQLVEAGRLEQPAAGGLISTPLRRRRPRRSRVTATPTRRCAAGRGRGDPAGSRPAARSLRRPRRRARAGRARRHAATSSTPSATGSSAASIRRPTPRRLRQVPGVGAEAVAEVDHRRRARGGEGPAGGEPRAWLELAAARAAGRAGAERRLEPVEEKRGGGGAELAGEDQRVAGPGSGPAHKARRRGRMSDDGDGEGEGRAAGHVAAGERRAGATRRPRPARRRTSRQPSSSRPAGTMRTT